MSVHAVSWVLRSSRAKLGDRLVLIVLADHAHSDGSNAYPSLETLAAEALLSTRQARRSLRRLEEMGEIVPTGKGPHGVNVYRLTMQLPLGADNMAPGQIGPQGLQGRTNHAVIGDDLSPEPSGNQEKEEEAKASPSVRKPDLLWDELVAVLGVQPATNSERGRWNKALKEIRDAGGTPADLRRAARAFHEKYGTAELTPTALSANWGALTVVTAKSDPEAYIAKERERLRSIG